MKTRIEILNEDSAESLVFIGESFDAPKELYDFTQALAKSKFLQELDLQLCFLSDSQLESITNALLQRTKLLFLDLSSNETLSLLAAYSR